MVRIPFTTHPWLDEVLTSAAVLLASYVAARLMSLLVERILTRSAQEAVLQRRLAVALRHPLTFLLFQVGVWAAAHRLPLSASALARFDRLLFVTLAALVALCLLRAFTVLLAWYVDGARERGESHVVEFAPLLSKLGRLFIAVVALITTLQYLGINVASLVVSLGVGSLAVGLAAQDTLANMIAGFVLVLDRPFRVGDRIGLSTGEMGDVEWIGMRSTQIRTLDENILVLPNSILVRDRLLNLSRPTREVVTRATLRVAYGTEVDRARALLEESARECPLAAPGRPVVVLVTALGDLGMELAVVFYVADYLQQGVARSAVLETSLARLGAAGITLPVVPAGVRPQPH